MIWLWLERLGTWVVLLFGKPPKLDELLTKKVDPNLKCPCCGHFDGELRCVEMPLQNSQTRILVQHRCKVCHARFFEAPVASGVDPTIVLHAVPVNDVEKAEDSTPSRGAVIQALMGRTH